MDLGVYITKLNSMLEYTKGLDVKLASGQTMFTVTAVETIFW